MTHAPVDADKQAINIRTTEFRQVTAVLGNATHGLQVVFEVGPIRRGSRRVKVYPSVGVELQGGEYLFVGSQSQREFEARQPIWELNRGRLRVGYSFVVRRRDRPDDIYGLISPDLVSAILI